MMTEELCQQFRYKFGCKGTQSTLTVPVPIPLKQTASDLTGRLVAAHNLPCYAQDGLLSSLSAFIKNETALWHDSNAQQALDRLSNGLVDAKQVASQWNKAFSEEVAAYAKPDVDSDESVFSKVYHSLIHSAAMEQMLKLEHAYALDMASLLQQKEHDLAHLEKRQAAEVDDALKNIGLIYTDEQVNQLTQRHIENTQMIESQWDSQVTSLQETQKREYKNWLMNVNDDINSSQQVPTYMTAMPSSPMIDCTPALLSRMEESFTIHLGAQLKTTHNLRLLSCDILDLCRHQPVGGKPSPQRIQTAMSLYSNSLCGMILLVDKRLNAYTGIKREFAQACQQSTDFHFPSLDRQFANVEQQLPKANEFRHLQRLSEEGDKISVQSGGSGSSDNQKEDKMTKLHSGDFYVTRHSNLSEVHVVFHLVTDDAINRTDISSRHPVIMALRNILKVCFRHDVTTISVPLLLTHEMTEEMTIPWCMKRAELVFKCVKGFMMEMSALCNSESKTIQFHVPKDLSDSTFAQFSSMLPSIFRLSNPIMGK